MLLLSLASTAAGRPQVSMAPSVLVLQTRATPETERRERALYDQLAVALDDFAVLLIGPPQEDFHQLSLPQQIALLVPTASAEGAVAVVWLVIPAPRQVMVHLIAQNAQRTMVKTVETTSGPEAEATLSLVVRELLGAAYLFEPPAALPGGLKAVVQEVRTHVAAPTPAPTPAPEEVRRSPWQLALVGATRFGGQVGGRLRGGLRASRGFFLGPLILSPTVELGLSAVEVDTLSLVALEATLGADLFAPLTRTVEVGPVLGGQVGVGWHRATLSGTAAEVIALAAVIEAGLRVRAPLSKQVRIVFEVGLGVRPVRTRLLLGDELLRREGWGEMRTALGLSWEVP